MASTTTSAKAVWTGNLKFSLISIPVKIYAAARTEGTSFNQVHQHADGTICKIQQKLHCPHCADAIVEPGNLSKGFAVNKGQFVIVTDEDLAALKPGKSNDVNITEFVSIGEVDPIFYDKSYFVEPDTETSIGSPKVYELLYQILKTKNVAGISKLTMRGSDYHVVVRPYGNSILIQTLFNENEVRAEIGIDRSTVVVSEREVALASTLVESMTKPFDESKLTDEYGAKVKALIATKQSAPAADGTSTQATTPNSTVDLMAALAASIKVAKKPTKKEQLLAQAA